MNKKIFFSTLSILSALAMMGGATFAYFTDYRVSQNNNFSAGTLKLDINQNPTGYSAFNVSDLQPEDSKGRCLEIDNTGNLDFNYKFSAVQNNTPTHNLSDVLTLQLDRWNGDGAPAEADCNAESQNIKWGDGSVYNGPLKTLLTNSEKLGPLKATEKAYYRITVSWPSGENDKDYQGATASYNFIINAFQLSDPAGQ